MGQMNKKSHIFSTVKASNFHTKREWAKNLARRIRTFFYKFIIIIIIIIIYNFQQRLVGVQI